MDLGRLQNGARLLLGRLQNGARLLFERAFGAAEVGARLLETNDLEHPRKWCQAT
jgi:hypothetical protein